MFQKWNYFLSLWPLLFPAWLWHRLWFFQRMLLPWLPLIYIGCSELRKRPAFISFIQSCIKAWFSWVFGSLLSFQSFSSWFSCQKMAFRFRSWCHVLLLILSQEWYSAFHWFKRKAGNQHEIQRWFYHWKRWCPYLQSRTKNESWRFWAFKGTVKIPLSACQP